MFNKRQMSHKVTNYKPIYIKPIIVHGQYLMADNSKDLTDKKIKNICGELQRHYCNL